MLKSPFQIPETPRMERWWRQKCETFVRCIFPTLDNRSHAPWTSPGFSSTAVITSSNTCNSISHDQSVPLSSNSTLHMHHSSSTFPSNPSPIISHFPSRGCVNHSHQFPFTSHKRTNELEKPSEVIWVSNQKEKGEKVMRTFYCPLFSLEAMQIKVWERENMIFTIQYNFEIILIWNTVSFYC